MWMYHAECVSEIEFAELTGCWCRVCVCHVPQEARLTFSVSLSIISPPKDPPPSLCALSSFWYEHRSRGKHLGCFSSPSRCQAEYLLHCYGKQKTSVKVLSFRKDIYFSKNKFENINKMAVYFYHF